MDGPDEGTAGGLPDLSRNPLLYQINTRVWLTELSRRLGRPATLDDVADEELDALAAAGFDIVYLLGVWRTGEAGRRVSRNDEALLEGYRSLLPDLQPNDICGSCFAIVDYSVAPVLGGDGALARLRARLHARGLRLMLDFVPNHTAPDHPWVEERPGYYVHGTEDDLEREPRNWTRVQTESHSRVLAHGRDPYFPGWPDTLQLNYGREEVRSAMEGELLRVAERCDGVRCDMAMLILPEVFRSTWGIESAPFWPGAIAAVHDVHPGFIFLAEVYWHLEWELQQQGFDYTYDKDLYDRLRAGDAAAARGHLLAAEDYQVHLARFLENHDEPRAASTFAPGVHKAAAVITFLSQGLRFLHQGQLEGRRAHVSVHLCRGPEEAEDENLAAFYRGLLPVLTQEVVRNGRWRLLEPLCAWEGNWTHDGFVAAAWDLDDAPGGAVTGGAAQAARRLIVVVNFQGHQGQCYVRLPWSGRAGVTWALRDQLSDASYERDGGSLLDPGLYVDMPAWGYHVFEFRSANCS